MAVFIAGVSLFLLGIAATVVFGWRAARRGSSLAGPSAFAFGSGLMTVGFGSGHLVGVATTELRRRVPVYDLRVYALVLLGVLLVGLGARLVWSAPGVSRGEYEAWRHAIIAEVVLLLVILPLTPIDAFAVALSIFASIGLASLLVIRLRLASSQPGPGAR